MVVVVSATSGTTDELQRIADLAQQGNLDYLGLILKLEEKHQTLGSKVTQELDNPIITEMFDQLRQVCKGVFLLKELTGRSKDFILGMGELISSHLITSFLQKDGIRVKRYDAREVITTDASYGNAVVDMDETKRKLIGIQPDFADVNVFPGFIAAASTGEYTTLGRGGSDYTASILAALLGSELLEIWTDVSGIMTADPRMVKRSHTLQHVSYEEALELSHFGAKVIYFQSILPVFRAGIPVKVKNTFAPEEEGTLISGDVVDKELIKGIVSTGDISVLTVSGSYAKSNADFFARLFKTLAQAEVPIVFMTHANAEYTVTFGFRSKDALRALEILKEEFKGEKEGQLIEQSTLEEGYSLIALIGENMKNQVGVSGNMFNILGKNGVSIKAISQGSSERNISAIIPNHDLSKAINVLHEGFFLSRMKRVNLFIIGVGNVGKAFLDQISKQFSFLKTEHQLNIKVIGIANSRKMSFEKDGIRLSQWAERLEEGEKFSQQAFLECMTDLNFRNSIFIDITASYEISDMYSDILSRSISVVTPNKIAATRSYEKYKELKAATKKYGSQFLIETNVCAGLPILSTLNDLVRSGDRITKLQAVLSGTLNFLFNAYDGSKPFVEVIKEAKQLGYTEPDPRLDLSGEDVLRKLLILTRESGYEMEMDDLSIHSFLPEKSQKTDDLDSFYKLVEEEEAHFRNLYETAKANGTRLKVVASYSDGVGKVALEEVTPDHPFYNLEGKDNVVLFYTNRYSEQPLVIKGAGAGAEVTASGIFADVLRLSQTDF